MIIYTDLHNRTKNYTLSEDIKQEINKKFNVQIVTTINSKAEVYWGDKLTNEHLTKMPNLKWIHFGGIGIDKVLKMNRNIIVTNSKGTMEEALASSSLSLIFSLSRCINQCYDLRYKNNLTRNSMNKYFNKLQDVFGQTILIVGCGSVGKKVSSVCEVLNMNVIKLISKDDVNLLPEMVKDSDFVLNLLPYTNETKSIFNKKVFENMQKTSYFINVGRGETVVEEDLIEALKNKSIAGAGLDVFEKEQKLPKSPLSEDSSLWNMNNVIITPHIAGWSKNYWKKQIDLFGENLKRYKNSEEMLNIINLNRGY